jgi:hypothetical protein
MGEIEEKVKQEEADRIAEDQRKWIVDRKRQYKHFNRLCILMKILNKDAEVNTAEHIWKNEIEPKINKE